MPVTRREYYVGFFGAFAMIAMIVYLQMTH